MSRQRGPVAVYHQNRFNKIILITKLHPGIWIDEDLGRRQNELNVSFCLCKLSHNVY